jgi:hypothetical protein
MSSIGQMRMRSKVSRHPHALDLRRFDRTFFAGPTQKAALAQLQAEEAKAFSNKTAEFSKASPAFFIHTALSTEQKQYVSPVSLISLACI